ncbi:MAG: arylesterase [Nitrosomonas sp.]|nr:arylesterase [Nitrosomonas sp.]
MVYGDSLSANYGIPTDAGWVALLEQRLLSHSPSIRIINASISGETTLGGRNRIAQALETHRPDIIILGLGANDGLRGATIKTIYENLAEIIKICQQHNTAVLLAGMQLPPNYGTTYTRKFQDIYPQLAEQYQTGLIPFLLAGFGEKKEFFQPDGIHPTAAAQKMIVENVWHVLQPVLHKHPTPVNHQDDSQNSANRPAEAPSVLMADH